jgi:hypothetical protein
MVQSMFKGATKTIALLLFHVRRRRVLLVAILCLLISIVFVIHQRNVFSSDHSEGSLLSISRGEVLDPNELLAGYHVDRSAMAVRYILHLYSRMLPRI